MVSGTSFKTRRKALLLGETHYFDQNDLGWLCLQWANTRNRISIWGVAAEEKRMILYYIIKWWVAWHEEECTRFKAWQKVPGNTQEIQQQGKIEGSILINTVLGPAQCLVQSRLSINADPKLNDVFKNVAVPAVCAPQSLQVKSHWCGLSSVCPPKKA